jgi:hypothetical protein
MSLWRNARRSFATGMKLVPHRFRFAAALVASRPAASLLAGSALFRSEVGRYQDGAWDLALFHLLDAMTKAGATFDLQPDTEGLDRLQDAIAEGRGALVCGAHSTLNFLTPRLLHDLGRTPLIIAVDPGMRIPGTTLTGCALPPSPTFMLRVRSWWRDGGLVCAALDNDVVHKRGRTRYETPLGATEISHPLLELAARCRVPVVFVGARVDGRRGLVMTFGVPSAASRTDAQQTAREMAAFVSEHAQKVAARDGRGDAVEGG